VTGDGRNATCDFSGDLIKGELAGRSALLR
jgi:hypothetical protein